MSEDIEGPFNALLPLFESELYVTCSSHASVINRYISNLFNRSHQRRLASYALQKETFDVTKRIISDSKLLRQLGAAYSFALQRPISLKSLQESFSAIESEETTEARKAQFLSNVVRYEEDLFEILRGRPYGILRAPEGTAFILGDTAIISRQLLSSGMTLAGVGFSRENVHALLPISPAACIQVGLYDRHNYTLSSAEVASINDDSVRLMHRFVYANTQGKELAENIKCIGGILQYNKTAFVGRRLTSEMLLDFIIFDLLQGGDDTEFLKTLVTS